MIQARFLPLIFLVFMFNSATAGILKWNCKPNVSAQQCEESALKIFANHNCNVREVECKSRGTQIYCTASSKGPHEWRTWMPKGCRTDCADDDGHAWHHADFNRYPDQVVLPQLCLDRKGEPVKVDAVQESGTSS